MIYPTLKSLKQKLNIQELNTNKQNDFHGMIFDNNEGLHAIGTIDGKIVLKSGTEMSFLQYRGEYKQRDTCFSNFYRIQTMEEKFIEICRTIAFEELLFRHPLIRIIEKTDIYLNKTVLAQHYELKTPYIDLTSNFDVASFFATCKYDEKEKAYFPWTKTNTFGAIYKVIEPLGFDDEYKFKYIGWQGLPRPEEQRASVYHLTDNDLNKEGGVYKYKFKHSPYYSKMIWNKFNKGKDLFPHDSAVDLANKCKELKKFTSAEIDLARKRYKEWTNQELSNLEVLRIIDRNKIEISNIPYLFWDNFVDMSVKYWESKFDDVMKRTRSRGIYYSR